MRNLEGCWFSLVLALFWSIALGGPATAPSVTTLIDQLGNDRWVVRQSAVNQLVAMGDEVLPELTRALRQATDNEVRSRIRSAMSQIHENRTLGQSQITLKLDKVSPAKALEEISKLAGAKILVDPPNLLTSGHPKPVTLKFHRQPFWMVMRAFCRQTGLSIASITRNDKELGIGLTQGDPDWDKKPIDLSGPLMVRADRLFRQSNLPLRGPMEAAEEFTFSLTVFAEPKLRVLGYSPLLQLTQAIDEKGQSYVPPPTPVNPEDAGDNIMATNSAFTGTWDLMANLTMPKEPGNRIVKLRGVTVVEVQTRSYRLEIPISQSRNSSKSIDGIRFMIRSLDSNRCEVTLLRDGRADDEWMRLRTLMTYLDAYLLDEKGQVVGRAPRGIEPENDDGNRMDLTMRFARESGEVGREAKQKRIDAVKMVWEFPADTRLLTLPVEFGDLPVPK